MTALMHAVDNEQIICVMEFCKSKNEIGKYDLRRRTALMHAVSKKSLQCVKELYIFKEEYKKDSRGHTVLTYAASCELYECIRYLADRAVGGCFYRKRDTALSVRLSVILLIVCCFCRNILLSVWNETKLGRQH